MTSKWTLGILQTQKKDLEAISPHFGAPRGSKMTPKIQQKSRKTSFGPLRFHTKKHTKFQKSFL